MCLVWLSFQNIVRSLGKRDFNWRMVCIVRKQLVGITGCWHASVHVCVSTYLQLDGNGCVYGLSMRACYSHMHKHKQMNLYHFQWKWSEYNLIFVKHTYTHTPDFLGMAHWILSQNWENSKFISKICRHSGEKRGCLLIEKVVFFGRVFKSHRGHLHLCIKIQSHWKCYSKYLQWKKKIHLFISWKSTQLHH